MNKILFAFSCESNSFYPGLSATVLLFLLASLCPPAALAQSASLTVTIGSTQELILNDAPQAIANITLKSGASNLNDIGAFRLIAQQKVSFSPDTGVSGGGNYSISTTFSPNDTLVIHPGGSEFRLSAYVLLSDNLDGELTFSLANGDEFGSNQISGLSAYVGTYALATLDPIPSSENSTETVDAGENPNRSLFDASTGILHLPEVEIGSEYYWLDLQATPAGALIPVDFGPLTTADAVYPSRFDINTNLLTVPHTSILQNGNVDSTDYYLQLMLNSSTGQLDLVAVEENFLEIYETSAANNDGIGVILKNRNNESLVVFGDPDGETGLSDIHGMSVFDEDGNSASVFLDGNGLPSSIVMGEYVLNLSNYASSTVDVTIIGPDGLLEELSGVHVSEAMLQEFVALYDSLNSESLVTYSAILADQSDYTSDPYVASIDKKTYVAAKIASVGVSMAGCIASGALAVGTSVSGVGALAFGALMISQCGSAGYALGDLLQNGVPEPGVITNSDKISTLQCITIDVSACTSLAISVWATENYTAESAVIESGGKVRSKLTGSVSATGIPDLTVANFSSPSATINAGGVIDFNVMVSNSGTADATQVTVNFYRSPIAPITENAFFIGSVTIPLITAGNSEMESFEYTAPDAPNSYFFGACVEVQAKEENDTNQCTNGTLLEISSGGHEDLVFHHLQLTNSSGTPLRSDRTGGDTIKFVTTVKNDGSASPAIGKIRFYRSPLSTITTGALELGSVDISINPGYADTKTFAYELPNSAASYFFGACITATNDTADAICSEGIEVKVKEKLSVTGITCNNHNLGQPISLFHEAADGVCEVLPYAGPYTFSIFSAVYSDGSTDTFPGGTTYKTSENRLVLDSKGGYRGTLGCGNDTVKATLSDGTIYTLPIRITLTNEFGGNASYSCNSFTENVDNGLSNVITSGIPTVRIYDSGQIDGDIVNISVNGYGVLNDLKLTAYPGTEIPLAGNGPFDISVYAVNEGSVSPNTAALEISNVVAGSGSQTFDASQGEFGSMSIVIQSN